MTPEELSEVKEKISNLSYLELRDPKIVYELTRIFTLCGDIFNLIKLPSGTNLSFSEQREYEKSKGLFRDILKNSNKEEVKEFNKFVEKIKDADKNDKV